MTHDPTTFYATVAALSPVLLLTTVVGFRGSVTTGKAQRALQAGYVLTPAFLAVCFSLGYLAGGVEYSWQRNLVLLCIALQFGAALKVMWNGVLDPDRPVS